MNREALSLYFERLAEFGPSLVESLWETAIMLGFASIAAIIIGLPLGTLLYLTARGRILENKWMYQTANIIVNIIRSFPFLLLVIALQPLVRMLYGRATGNPVAASFPMMVIAVALYARSVEQSLSEVPKGVVETGRAMGASLLQLVTKFLYVEARSSLIIGFTTSFVSFISYSTIMGVVGGGGIGQFAIRYGYQRFEDDIMYTAIVVIIILVQIVQWFGLKTADSLDKR